MTEYDTLSVSLPRDPAGRRFMGVSGKMFRAFRTSEVENDTEELAVAVGLVAADGESQLLGQTTKAGSLPVTIASDDDLQTKIGIVTETAPGSDTASSGLNGRLQRIAQHLTSLATLTGQGNETAPSTDTASSGLNGRLQRIAQRLSTIIGLLPTALTSGGGLKVGIVDALPASTNVIGYVAAQPHSNAIGLVIANGQTESAGLDISIYKHVAVTLPSTFDGTTITFKGSFQDSGYVDIYDILNNKVTMTVAADRAYDLPEELKAFRFIKIVSGTAQSGGDTTLLIHLKG